MHSADAFSNQLTTPKVMGFDEFLFDPRPSLAEHADKLDVWDERLEAEYASLTNPVPTVHTVHEVSHMGVRGNMYLASPEDPALSVDKHGTIAVAGFMGPTLSYLKFIHALASITHGPVAAVDSPLTHGGLKRARDLHPRHIVNPFRLEGQMIGAATRKLQDLRPQSPDTVNVVGHSKGGGVSSEFAAQKPEMVNKLVLNKSVGVIDHRFLPMAGRLLKAVPREVYPLVRRMEPSEYIPLGKGAVGRAVESPGRLIIEGHRAGTTKRLRRDIAMAIAHDVEVTAMWGQTDTFFHPDEEITVEIMKLISHGLLMNTDHVPEQGEPKRAALGVAFLLGSIAARQPLTVIPGGKIA